MGGIIICRADELENRVIVHQPVAVLSIEQPKEPGKLFSRSSAPRIDSVPQKILAFWDSELPCDQGPDRAQIETGIQFVMDHIQKGTVIIHCHAGKARSTALALGVLALTHPEETENQLIERLLVIRNIAAPNILVVQHVDDILGRGGKLVEAVLNHEQLTAARQGTEQSRMEWVKKNPEKAKELFPEKFPPKKPEM